MRNYLKIGLIAVLNLITLGNGFGQQAEKQLGEGYLIAHRGGVVDSLTAENSLQALRKAAQRGYWMVEIDLRLTKDSVLITHHDRNFNRYYGVDSLVSSMTWEEISKLKGDLGNEVLRFEEVLRFCQDNNLNVMVDNKIRGVDTLLFSHVIDLMKKYDRYEQAMMIGTEESTPFFTGKVRLSCTREQLENNMLKPGYNPSHYYLFSGDISKEEADWALENDILAVGVINAWGMKSDDVMKSAGQKAKKLKSAGVKYFQIDSAFDVFFE